VDFLKKASWTKGDFTKVRKLLKDHGCVLEEGEVAVLDIGDEL
jgi:hypothetical protein